MATEIANPRVAAEEAPRLMSGDRLTRAEFERRYSAMPDVKKAELIEGVVFMPSPVSHDGHSRPHIQIATWIGCYDAATPVVDAGDNGTVRLDFDNEPQPDVILRVLPKYGGQTRLSNDYIDGPPELVAEVAASSVSYDLHDKKNAYRRNGVKEYIVWRTQDAAVDWFVLREGRYESLAAGEDGIHRSRVFPGLWLEATALLAGDMKKVLDVVRRGTESKEHQAFVAQLQKRADEN